MNRYDQAWQKLAAAARRAPRDETPLEAPPGFATRVVARSVAREPALGSLLERFSWRALGVAGLLAAVCVAADYSLLSNGASDDEWPTDENSVAVELDLTS